VYLLPDQSRAGKRKTKMKHATLDPEFNEEMLVIMMYIVTVKYLPLKSSEAETSLPSSPFFTYLPSAHLNSAARLDETIPLVFDLVYFCSFSSIR
jgi:hypothetical protein